MLRRRKRRLSMTIFGLSRTHVKNKAQVINAVENTYDRRQAGCTAMVGKRYNRIGSDYVGGRGLSILVGDFR